MTFARCYSNPLITKFSGSWDRQSCSSEMLKQSKGSITIKTMMDILGVIHHAMIRNLTKEALYQVSVCMVVLFMETKPPEAILHPLAILLIHIG